MSVKNRSIYSRPENVSWISLLVTLSILAIIEVSLVQAWWFPEVFSPLQFNILQINQFIMCNE